ncbi:sigma-70 region 4 domain-containing protein [Sphingobium sp. H39-3-25]|uniref:sigma-70 region 4 domain-containing protein n=1 Tax=Sphingobium arseniciresistens TaxID=3030834 RepID=UPI0023B99E46|nr:sigma-70 region 4 domain-containing protein [Sphingobium arseniciresistens]
MPPCEVLDLLKEALDLFNDKANFALRRDRERTSYKLAARIDDLLQRFDGPKHLAIDEARERWSAASSIRIDPNERIVEQSSGGGYWVRAWVFVERPKLGEPGTPLRTRYEAALAMLPSLTREILLAHRVDDLDYVAIAARFDIAVGAVQQHITDALESISKVLDDD